VFVGHGPSPARYEEPAAGVCDAELVAASRAWLEDAAGRVYDVVGEEMTCTAKERGMRFAFQPLDLIEGRSKEQLARRGLHYTRAPPGGASERLLAAFGRLRGSAYEDVLELLRTRVLH
jgi:hypothetical protein